MDVVSEKIGAEIDPIAYADDIGNDIVYQKDQPQKVQLAMLEFESACAYTGLRFNAKKCEQMVLNCTIKQLQPEDAMMEKVLVDGDEGGILYDAEGGEFLPEADQMVIQDLDQRELGDLGHGASQPGSWQGAS